MRWPELEVEINEEWTLVRNCGLQLEQRGFLGGPGNVPNDRVVSVVRLWLDGNEIKGFRVSRRSQT